MGLVSNALELFLKLLKPAERNRFDKTVTDILTHNALFGRSSILNSEKSIMKTTISETFAILFVTPIAIDCCGFLEGDLKKLKILQLLKFKNTKVRDELQTKDKDMKKCRNTEGSNESHKEDINVKKCKDTKVCDDEVHKKGCDKNEKVDGKGQVDESLKQKALKIAVEVLTGLNSIVLKSQRNPKSHQDRVEVMRAFNDCNGRTLLNKLVKDVKEHCETIEELSEIDPDGVQILDKPNMHRFVELFTHKLTLFGSLKFVEELILEKGNQGAKRSVDLSNKKNEQIQAMLVHLHDDFDSRAR